MLQARCPICDTPIETQVADATGIVHCARCGYAFDGEGLKVPAPALPGKQIFRVVQRLAKRPSFVLRATTSGKAKDPQAAHAALRTPKRRPFRWLARPELRRMFFAALVFLGIPAAVIFFVIVVCAPREDVAARRPVRAVRPQAAKVTRNSWFQKLRP